ncbi:AmpG family muropeptide MFS transporter [Rickettsia endosymbiont of Culicoides newsteadi]|uniref:AmpG family muropeptide MFS transporter n=1 Tax=Rickettsia endosymbiont of Culicoides newsteadi TaxID=1961830 RepID=UPI000B9C4D17|nr:MFS transporter [Rickettsia endosymbiont of Culicoides newsteadi]OZG32350.1 transporter [Rickettsia endosymbiont of Culicoides newsteadi]
MLTPSKLFIIWLFGLTSGFTLMITGNTLNYWLAKENIDLQSIGMFAVIVIPYSINFLWAPIFDTVKLGWLSKLLGHRLSWICLIQILLALAIFLLSTMDPNHSLILFALVGLIISFLSSAKDTVLGAFRTEIIAKESQGAASGIYIFGYRIGMLISGSGAIYLSSYLGWNNIYKIFAISVLVCSAILVVSILRLKHDLISQTYQDYKVNSSNFIQNILRPVGSLYLIFLIIIFLILYRLPDDFIGMMINPFLIHIGYNEFEIASAGKFFGIISAIIGGLIASSVMRKKNILDSLLIFGVIHAIAHTLFILQEIYGKNLPLFFITTGFESITGGMTMTAYIAFIASICQGKFRATQYSFFTSMMGFSRSIFPALSGYIVVQFGWQNFFTFIIITTIPSLLLLLKISSLLKVKMK